MKDEFGPARLSFSRHRPDFVLVQKDIGRFQVAVDDPLAVRRLDRMGQRLDQAGRLARRPGLAVQPVRQAAALDPLERQERPAVVAADLVDLHDVGVLHPRRQLCLQPETQLLGGRRELARQHHLEGHQPVEAPVPRLVHHPHASTSDFRQDVVVPDLSGRRANHRHCFRVLRSRGDPGFLRFPQSANRRAALGRGDQYLSPAGGVLLQPRQERIFGSDLIDHAATRGTVAEVGRDAGQLSRCELTQRQRKQLFGGRMIQRCLGHGKL